MVEGRSFSGGPRTVQKGTVLAHRDRLPDGAKITGSRRCPEEAVSDRVRSVPEGRRPGCFWMRRSIRHRSARLWGVNLSGPKPARYCRFCGESENDVGRLLTNGGAVLPRTPSATGASGSSPRSLASGLHRLRRPSPSAPSAARTRARSASSSRPRAMSRIGARMGCRECHAQASAGRNLQRVHRPEQRDHREQQPKG